MVGWGASWTNAKVLSFYIDEYEMVLFRFSLTALTLIPIIIVLQKSFYVSIKTIFYAFVTSLFLVAYMKYYFLGTKYGTASLGGAFVTTLAPIITFLLYVLFGARKLRKRDWFALALGALGVSTMLNIFTFKSEEVFTQYNLYFLLAATLWPLVTILSSKSKDTSPIVFTFYLYIFSSLLVTLFFIDFNTIAYASFDSTFYLHMGSLILFSTTFSNTIYFLGIERLGVAEVSSFIFLVPFSAIVLSALLIDEEIGVPVLIGTLLTLFAVKILNNINFFRKGH
ncbi:MAG: DMT family transporter [Epsilonproteobacteria bacterium]|nr:DMT family transporter [Campylobacterota bacterium]